MVSEIAEATAVTSEDTAAPVVAAPPAEALPDEDAIAPETESVDAPETDVPLAELSDPFADLDDDSIRSHERVQKLVRDEAARQAESDRRKAQAESARREAQRKEQYFRSGEYMNELQELLRRGASVDDDGQVQVRLDGKRLVALSDQVWSGASLAAFEQMDAVYRDMLPSGYRLTQEDADRLESIKNDAYAGRKPGEELIEARLGILREAWREADREEDRKAIRREVKAEMERAARNAATKAADAKRQAEPSPTIASGNSAGTMPGSMAEADAAYASGSLSHADYKKYREQHGIGVLPGGGR